MKLSIAHEGQQEMLQRLQSKNLKLKKMEEACKKQEQVIEKMEELLSSKPQKNRGEGKIHQLCQQTPAAGIVLS